MEDDNVLQLRKQFGKWLADENWQPQLLDWLQGYGLPSSRYELDPYEWLLRALPKNERSEVELQFTTRLVSILAKLSEDNYDRATYPEECIYNLFMLCAGLRCRKLLGRPLFKIYTRLAQKCEWLETSILVAFESALIGNQCNTDLQPVWEAMLAGKTHNFLPGDEYSGFEGVTYMPQSEVAWGEPFIAAIGKALTAMMKYLESEHNRRPELQRLIRMVIATYPGRPTWDEELLLEANLNQWPDWAVACLPKLYIHSSMPNSHVRRTYFMWEILLPLLRKFNHSLEQEDRAYCGGVVTLVHLSEDAEAFLDQIVPIVEKRRLSLPYKSYKAVVGAVNDALSDPEFEASLSLPITLSEVPFNLQVRGTKYGWLTRLLVFVYSIIGKFKAKNVIPPYQIIREARDEILDSRLGIRPANLVNLGAKLKDD